MLYKGIIFFFFIMHGNVYYMYLECPGRNSGVFLIVSSSYIIAEILRINKVKITIKNNDVQCCLDKIMQILNSFLIFTPVFMYINI